MLLHELIPEIFVVGDQFQVRRQAEVMSVRCEQLYAEAVNRTKVSAIERLDDFQGKSGLENPLASALLHLIGGAVGVGDDDQLG